VVARKTRIEFPGAFYHVLSRGNNRQEVFQDEQDYRIYLRRLEKYREQYKFILYAFVLMPNHVHLLIETGHTNLSKIMQGIQQSYTSYYHKKYKSVGHLFQGRYKAILCQRDAYLLELVRYIHLNPVRSGLVESLEDYAWSSHHSFFGHLKQPYVDKILILAMFSEDKHSALKRYLQFIQDGMDEGHQERFYEVVDQRYLGSSEFIENIKQTVKRDEDPHKKEREKELRFKKAKELPEILKAVAEVTLVTPESLLSESRERSVSNARSLLALIGTRYAGISNKSIAEYLGRDPSSVTNMLHRIEEKIKSEKVISQNLDQIIKLLKV